eukprot:g16735.t1
MLAPPRTLLLVPFRRCQFWLFGYGENVSNLDRFMAYLGLVYFWAFSSYYIQVRGLYGDDGLLPISEMGDLSKDKSPLFKILCTSADSFCTRHPALFTELLSLVGMAASLLLYLVPKSRAVKTAVCLCNWQLYLALYCVGGVFLSFQWDILLLEVGFISNLYNLSNSHAFHAVCDFLVRGLFVKLMFMTGVVKISSGCDTWKNLTALEYHYVSQCLPTELAWFFHQLPPYLNRIGVGFMFSLQLSEEKSERPGYGIAATGNYNWFNALSVILLWPVVGSHAALYSEPKVFRSRSVYLSFVTGQVALTGLLGMGLLFGNTVEVGLLQSAAEIKEGAIAERLQNTLSELLWRGDYVSVKSAVRESDVRDYLHWYTQYGLVLVQCGFLLAGLYYLVAVFVDEDPGSSVLALMEKKREEKLKQPEKPLAALRRSPASPARVSSGGAASPPGAAKTATKNDNSKSNVYGEGAGRDVEGENLNSASEKKTAKRGSPFRFTAGNLFRVLVLFPLAIFRVCVVFVALNLGFLPWAHLGPTNFFFQREVMEHVYKNLPPNYHVSNSYGLFRRMTGVGPHDYGKQDPRKNASSTGRSIVASPKSTPQKSPYGFAGLDHRPVPKVPALIVEYREANAKKPTWNEVSFPYAPGGTRRMPVRAAPYQPRLDWQMWFASLAPQYQGQDWLLRLVWVLTRGYGDGDVRELLELWEEPKLEGFGGEKTPKKIQQVRVARYHYDFTRVENQSGDVAGGSSNATTSPWHPRKQARVGGGRIKGKKASAAESQHDWWVRERDQKIWLDEVDAAALAPVVKRYGWGANKSKSQKKKTADDETASRLQEVLDTFREQLVTRPKRWVREKMGGGWVDGNFALLHCETWREKKERACDAR